MRRMRDVSRQLALYAATAVVLASPAVAQDYASKDLRHPTP